MKVNETQHGQIQDTSIRRRQPAEEGAESFQEIMNRMSGHGPVGQPSVPGPGPVPVLDGVQIVAGSGRVDDPSSPALAKERVLQEIRDTLDMIDRYAMDLGNPSLSTAEMKPLVEHLEARMAGLRRMEADPAMPEALRNVVSDLAVTIGMEAAKFGRGDYD